MKFEFKQLMIIFLTALLGASIGSFSISAIHDKDVPPTTLKLSQVEYTTPVVGNYTKTIEKTIDSVVVIKCTTQMHSTFYGAIEGSSQGSGVIVSEDGYIVTNNHVVENSTQVNVELSNGEELEAKIIGTDSKTDVAIIKIEKNNLPFATLASSDQLVLGQEVIVIGNPLGQGISVSNGIVSALQKEVYLNNVYMDLIQTNAAVNEGNSGGGMFDLQGNLIGIVNAKTSSSLSSNVEGMGYAIPSNTVLRIMQDLMEYGYVRNRATIGVSVYTQSAYYTQDGILISDVVEGGGAAEVGIKPGDIITAINGVPVTTYADLSKALDKLNIGDQITLTIKRDGSSIDFIVTLHEAIAN